MNKIYLIAFLFFCASIQLFAQRTIHIQLADSLRAEVLVNYEGYYNGTPPQGRIAVYEPGSDLAIVGVEVYAFHDDDYMSTLADTVGLDLQSWLVYEDLNFDGHKDLAIIDGSLTYDGDYRYQVFLGDGKGGFTPNESFSESLDSSFTIDPKKQELSTTMFDEESDDKQRVSVYKVVNNKLQLLKSYKRKIAQ